MKTWKNAVAEKSKVLTTIWFAQGEKPSDFGKWIECDELELDASSAVHVFTVGGTRFFGRI